MVGMRDKASVQCEAAPGQGGSRSSCESKEGEFVMAVRPTYEELAQRVRELEKEGARCKRAEEALGASEERFRLTFENAVDAIFWADAQTGLISRCNKAAEVLLERSRDEIIGKPQTMLHPPQRIKYYADIFKTHIEKGGAIDDEAEVVTRSGRIIPVHITASVTSVRERTIIQGIFRDITRQKLAEDALRESEDKYSKLVENSLTGIYIDQDGRIVFANSRFAQIFRYRREELLGIEAQKLTHPDDRALTNRIRVKRMAGEEAPSEYEIRGLTGDGETIWVIKRNTRIELQGKPAILGNIVDITKRKQAEEQLRKTNEELQNFVDIVSHDLKTPIIAIHGLSSRLQKGYAGKLGGKGERYVEQIQTNCSRMDLLVSDLLALARIGRVVSAFRDVPTLKIVKRVISALRERLEEDGIELTVGDNLPTIFCDGDRIYQVFENLLVNAVKFTRKSETPRIEIGCEDKGEIHQFFVKDNGIGIDPKHHRKIFEMFQRLGEVKDEEGTGLGLAIVERIVNNHGGKIWVESEKGKGAAFYFTLPKRKDTEETSARS
jgi:PAS domain S-box-containing protein